MVRANLANVKDFIDKYENNFMNQERSQVWNWAALPLVEGLSDEDLIFATRYYQWLKSTGEDEIERMWSVYQKCLKAFLTKTSSYLAYMHRNKFAREFQEV